MKLASVRTTRLQRTLAVTALLLLSAFQLVHAARVYSATWDEPHHLYDGYNIWMRHDYRLNPEVPPLVKLTAALPLLRMHLNAPPDQGRSEPKEAFLDGRAFVFNNGGDRVLFRARMACTIFALLLAWLIYAAARNLFGSLAALFALTMFIFDPNILANGTLVTTDVCCACGLFGAVYAFYRYVKAPSAMGLAVAGLAAGLTMVTKFTGILLAPMLLLLVMAEALRMRSAAVLGRLAAACGCILLCAWIVIWSFYGFRYKSAPDGLELKTLLAPYIQSMPSRSGASKLTFLAHYRLLPEPYLWGLANTKKTEWEYTSYFFGRVYRHGPWQYFPAAFLIKSTLPLLALLVLFPLLWFGRRNQHGRELYFLLTPVGVYFSVVTASHFDIGARHLLPIYPFLYVLAAAGGSVALRRGPAWAAGAGALLVWQIATSVRVGPAYMAYGNEAWGGPSQVHRYLSDANVDWGQQLKAVKLYLDNNHITNCWFAYFPDGAIEPSDYGVHCRRLPTTSSLWWLKLPMEVPPAIEGTVLLSDSDLEGIEFGDGTLNPYDAFRGVTPAAVIQGGINVYQGRFAVPLASALVDVRRSGELDQRGETQGALNVAARAVDLAPGSAITQLNLADLLAAQKQWDRALSHYQAADVLTRTVRPDLQEEDLLPKITAGLSAAHGHL